MREIEAVLFDLDGTLFDTREFIFRAFRHSLRKHTNKRVKWEDIEHVLGKPLIDCYGILFPSGDMEVLCQTHKDFQANNLHLVKPFAKSRATLKKLVEEGIKNGLVSSRHNDTLSDNLKATKIDYLLEVVITADDVTNHKPHPEPLLKALDALKVSPKNALMVGDTDVDILAGKNAGMRTVGVTYGFHGARIVDAKPDWVIDDISELWGIVDKINSKR